MSSEKPNEKTSGWTEKEKLVFYVSLIETGAATIDWSKVILPPGKTRNAINKMMSRTRKQLKSEIDAMKAGGEVGEGSMTANETKKSTKKGGSKRKKDRNADNDLQSGEPDPEAPMESIEEDTKGDDEGGKTSQGRASKKRKRTKAE